MQHSLYASAFRFLKRRENGTPPLWDKAEPVPLNELKTQLAALTNKRVAEKSDQHQDSVDYEILTLEYLWKVFEELEEIDDCRVIY